MTNLFQFLQAEWPDVHEAATRAANAAHPDPRTSCFYARRALELAVSWAFKSDASLRLPYQDNLSALIHEPTFKAAAGEDVFNKARVINTLAFHRRDAKGAGRPVHVSAAPRPSVHPRQREIGRPRRVNLSQATIR